MTARGGGFGRTRYQSRGIDAWGSSVSSSRRTSQSSSTAALHEPAASEDEELAYEHDVFVEERFGRNLPIALAQDAKIALRRRIAGTLVGELAEEPVERAVSARQVSGVSENDVFLFPTGMNSIYHAHQTLMLERAMIQQGVPMTKKAIQATMRTMADPSFVGPIQTLSLIHI